MRMPENFDAEVYAVVAEIPAGRVVSYKQIARLLTNISNIIINKCNLLVHTIFYNRFLT